MKKFKTNALIGAVAAASLLLSGCSGTDSMPEVTTGDAAVDQLIKDAQAEGEVIWYQVPDTATAEAISSAFQEKYGITATFARTTSADLAQRYTAEQESGSPSADVILPLAGEFFDNAVQKGWVTPLEDLDIPGDPGASLADERIQNTVPFSAQTYGWAVNTDLVPDSEIPQSWEDLLDPKWKGKIQIPDPSASPNYIAYWKLVADEMGMDYLGKLKEQIGRVQGSSTSLTQSLAAGESSIALTAVTAAIAPTIETGAPIKFVNSDPGIVAPTVVGISAKADHPNAAKLFTHFLLSDEGVAAFNSPEGVDAMDVANTQGEMATTELQEDAMKNKDEILNAFGF